MARLNTEERVNLLGQARLKKLRMTAISKHLSVSVSWVSQYFSGAEMTDDMEEKLIEFIKES